MPSQRNQADTGSSLAIFSATDLFIVWFNPAPDDPSSTSDNADTTGYAR